MRNSVVAVVVDRRFGDRLNDLAKRLPIEMQPGDALIFHGMIQHYTAPNNSNLRRRAMGIIWQFISQTIRRFT